MRRALVLACLSTILVAMLAGTAAAAVTFRATSSNNWNPTSRHVNNDTRVVWRNPTNRDHTVTATTNNWSKNVRLDPGERTAFTFHGDGTYRFRCNIHAGMTGRVVVG